jgi:hypothetical protein
MPLPKETSNTVVPNSLIIPQIVLQTYVSNGQLVTSATITLQDAYYDQATSRWVETGGVLKTVYIPNIYNLDDDIASLQTDVIAIVSSLIDIIGDINSIRKVL